MKTFLETLRNELEKKKISQEEINEIIADHEEMIESAIAEGLHEAKIKEKFGDPKHLAEELLGFSQKERKMENNEYELFKELEVETVDAVEVKLVNADYTYEEDDNETIRVYAKNLTEPKDYEVLYEKNTFTLRRKSKLSFRLGTHKSPSFRIVVPAGLSLETASFLTTNGDCNISNVKARNVAISTTNGDMEIAKVKAEVFNLKDVNGDLVLSEISTKTLKFNTISGDVTLRSIEVENDVEVSTVSGDVEVDDLSCDNASFRTVSGDLNAKEFYPNTLALKSVSGDITVHNSDKTHHIEVTKRTVSGDVTIN